MQSPETDLLTDTAGMLTGLSMAMWIKCAEQNPSTFRSVSSKEVVR